MPARLGGARLLLNGWAAGPFLNRWAGRGKGFARPARLLLAIVLAAACTSAPHPPPRTTLVVGLVGEPAAVLDAADPTARFVAGLVAEPLVRRDDKDELVPRLAEQVPTFDNGLVRIVADDRSPAGKLVVRFPLRPGLAWHDGAPLTSEDVRFAWERDRAAPRSSRARAEADLVERVEASDPRTVGLELRPGVRTARYPVLPRALPRHLLQGASEAATAAYERQPVHAGPFAVASRQQGYGMTLTPFARYASGEPALSRVEVRFYPTRDALVDALARGEVEMAPAASLAADLIPRLERFVEQRGLLARYTPQQSADFLLFNLRHGAFKDARVRRAVALAVDRRAIVRELFAGRARLPSSYLFGPSWAATDVPPLPDPDPQAARALLAGAGYCAAKRCSGAPTVHARLVVESGSPPRLAAADLVARDLAAVGVVATVFGYASNAMAGALASGEFDLAIAPRGSDDPAEATAEYTGGPANPTGFTSAWFDLLASAAANALTRAERRPFYAELQRLWSAELPALPLYQHLAVDVAPDKLEGVAPTAHGEPISWSAASWRFAGR